MHAVKLITALIVLSPIFVSLMSLIVVTDFTNSLQNSHFPPGSHTDVICTAYGVQAPRYKLKKLNLPPIRVSNHLDLQIFCWLKSGRGKRWDRWENQG